MTSVLPAALKIDTRPPTPSFTTVRLATVRFGVKFRLAATGTAVPVGNRVRKLFAVGLVTATLRATADTPVAGMPAVPEICTSMVALVPRGPVAPVPVRVSSSLIGVSGWKPAPGMSTGTGFLAKIWVVMNTCVSGLLGGAGGGEPRHGVVPTDRHTPIPTWVNAGFKMLALCPESDISWPWRFEAATASSVVPFMKATFSPVPE
jgi:hypothetical protein